MRHRCQTYHTEILYRRFDSRLIFMKQKPVKNHPKKVDSFFRVLILTLKKDSQSIYSVRQDRDIQPYPSYTVRLHFFLIFLSESIS